VLIAAEREKRPVSVLLSVFILFICGCRGLSSSRGNTEFVVFGKSKKVIHN
jgi:hypothetical protein